MATYLLLLSLHFSGICTRNLLFLEAIKKRVLTTYPHLTTHHPRISFHQFPQTTFTHFQGTECQHIALNLTMAHVHNIAQHHIETPNKRCQMELLTHGTHEGSVVEDAVERTHCGSPDVNRCVASQSPEDFTAHLEMHPLKHWEQTSPFASWET